MIKSTLAAITLATLVAAPTAQAQVKIGILDMNAIFTQYHRTKDAESKLNDARAAAKTELDTRLETLKKSMDEINKLNADFEKPELSKDAKEKAARERDEKVVEARNLDREIAEFRGTRERQLQEQFIRMRKDLIDDIMKIVTEKVNAGGYDLVLDKSGMSMGQVSVVLFSKEGMDFSSEIIDILNKDAAKAAAPAKKE